MVNTHHNSIITVKYKGDTMYKLNDKEVEIIEAEVADGQVQVLAANYTTGDMAELTEDECLVLEEQYQDSLQADYYSMAVDYAYDSIDMER